MAFFRPDSPKRELPQNSVLFGIDSSAGVLFFLVGCLILGRKNPLPLISEALFFLCSLLLVFPFEFIYFIVQKTVVFIYIPPYRIQHKFFVYLFCRTVMKPAKFFVLFYVSKMAFCLYGADLAVQYPLPTLYIGVGFFLSLIPTFIDFHDLIFLCVFSGIIFI